MTEVGYATFALENAGVVLSQVNNGWWFLKAYRLGSVLAHTPFMCCPDMLRDRDSRRFGHAMQFIKSMISLKSQHFVSECVWLHIIRQDRPYGNTQNGLYLDICQKAATAAHASLGLAQCWVGSIEANVANFVTVAPTK